MYVFDDTLFVLYVYNFNYTDKQKRLILIFKNHSVIYDFLIFSMFPMPFPVIAPYIGHQMVHV